MGRGGVNGAEEAFQSSRDLFPSTAPTPTEGRSIHSAEQTLPKELFPA